MIETLTGWLTIINLTVLIGGGIAGFFALRSGIVKAEQEVQTRVREALQDENELLRSQFARQGRELAQIKALLQLLIETLKKHRHLDIEAGDDMVVIRDGQQTFIAHLPQDAHNGP